jgi:hypothetical protein
MQLPFFHKEVQSVLAPISHYRILGFIPLGMLLHIGISTAITIILLKRGMKFRNVFIIVFLVGLSKEILDCFVLNNTMKKHILDMCYDMAYPTFLYLKDRWRDFVRNRKQQSSTIQ